MVSSGTTYTWCQRCQEYIDDGGASNCKKCGTPFEVVTLLPADCVPAFLRKEDTMLEAISNTRAKAQVDVELAKIEVVRGRQETVEVNVLARVGPAGFKHVTDAHDQELQFHPDDPRARQFIALCTEMVLAWAEGRPWPNLGNKIVSGIGITLTAAPDQYDAETRAAIMADSIKLLQEKLVAAEAARDRSMATNLTISSERDALKERVREMEVRAPLGSSYLSVLGEVARLKGMLEVETDGARRAEELRRAAVDKVDELRQSIDFLKHTVNNLQADVARLRSSHSLIQADVQRIQDKANSIEELVGHHSDSVAEGFADIRDTIVHIHAVAEAHHEEINFPSFPDNCPFGRDGCQAYWKESTTGAMAKEQLEKLLKQPNGPVMDEDSAVGLLRKVRRVLGVRDGADLVEVAQALVQERDTLKEKREGMIDIMQRADQKASDLERLATQTDRERDEAYTARDEMRSKLDLAEIALKKAGYTLSEVTSKASGAERALEMWKKLVESTVNEARRSITELTEDAYAGCVSESAESVGRRKALHEFIPYLQKVVNALTKQE
jgi:hypothetical protein